MGHADQRARLVDPVAVGRITPAMIGTGETWRIALVVAAQPHDPMGAAIEKDQNFVLPVAGHDDRIGGHAGDEIVVQFGNQPFMPDQQPGAGEDALKFPVEHALIGENLPADGAAVAIDPAACIPHADCAHCRFPPRLPGNRATHAEPEVALSRASKPPGRSITESAILPVCRARYAAAGSS